MQFGAYIGEILPKFVQRARVTNGNDLEVGIAWSLYFNYVYELGV